MKDFIRFTIGWIMYPFVILTGNIYKLYQSVVKRKTINLKYNDIVDGFSYLIVKNPEVEKVAKARAGICARCPFAEYIRSKPNTIIVGNKTHSIKSMKCSVCGCALAAKVRAMNDECPRERWQARLDIV